MRLSILYRQPLHLVMEWPAAHVSLVLAYLSKQPAPDERIEIQLAGIQSMLANRYRKEGSRQKNIEEFLYYRNPWADELSAAPDHNDTRYSDVDRQFLRALSR